ncbi:hypothetical protein G6F59_015290 [Rhizopus arrhizus]|nr:hypothetical protein G6F59_015290 [Rhizopus arrhizus]
MESRSSKLRDRRNVVRRTVGRAHRVRHLEIQDAVDLQLRVVARDADLAGHGQRDFLERVLVRHAFDERDDEARAGRQDAVEFAQALDHPGVLLRHDGDRLDDDQDRQRDDDEQDDSGSIDHDVKPLLE